MRGGEQFLQKKGCHSRAGGYAPQPPAVGIQGSKGEGGRGGAGSVQGVLLPSVGTNMQPVPIAVCVAASPARPWVRGGSGCSVWRDFLPRGPAEAVTGETGQGHDVLTHPTALNSKAFGHPGDKNKQRPAEKQRGGLADGSFLS